MNLPVAINLLCLILLAIFRLSNAPNRRFYHFGPTPARLVYVFGLLAFPYRFACVVSVHRYLVATLLRNRKTIEMVIYCMLLASNSFKVNMLEKISVIYLFIHLLVFKLMYYSSQASCQFNPSI